MQKHLIISALQLIDSDIFDNQSNQIGTIKEFMIDDVSGHIIYAIVAIKGPKSLSNKLFPIPFELCLFEPKSNTFQLQISVSQLHQAPCFSKQQWPDLANENWQKQMRGYYQALNANQPSTESATI